MTGPAYPALPWPPAALADQTATQRGLAILAFVLATDTTATVTTADLALADHAGPAALAGQYSDIVRESLQRARSLVAATLRRRALADQALAGPDKPDSLITRLPADERLNDGPMARLEPVYPGKGPAAGRIQIAF